MKTTAVLQKRHNPNTGRSEYALVSHDKTKVLKWFGTKRPTHDEFLKEERRVQFMKHMNGCFKLMSSVQEVQYPTLTKILADADVEAGKKKPISDEAIKDALEFMKEHGLVPTGKGSPTRPSQTPDFSVVYDTDEEMFFLVIELNSGEQSIWEITPKGDYSAVGSGRGTFQPGENQIVYDESEFRDHVPLEVIQAVYSIVDPEFNKPREGEDMSPQDS